MPRESDMLRGRAPQELDPDAGYVARRPLTLMGRRVRRGDRIRVSELPQRLAQQLVRGRFLIADDLVPGSPALRSATALRTRPLRLDRGKAPDGAAPAG